MRKASPIDRTYDKEENSDPRINITDNVFTNAIAVMDNLVARATTRWTLEESKLFICSLSKIDSRDADGWVKLPKRDLNRIMEKSAPSASYMIKLAESMLDKSKVRFHGPTADDWEVGRIINKVRSDRWYLYVQFERDYLPLLERLSKRFTSVYVESIARLEHKASYSLYLYLMSWADRSALVQKRKIFKDEIQEVFNFEPKLIDGKETMPYWRNYGTDRAKFDWAAFELKVLKPAIADINAGVPGKSEILIDGWDKLKDGRFTTGYEIEYTLVDENGYVQ